MTLNQPVRDKTQQAMAAVLLRSIPTKSPEEIEAIYSRMNIWLIEMIEQGGLSSDQLNAVSEELLKISLDKDEISLEQLEAAGLASEKIHRLAGKVTEQPTPQAAVPSIPQPPSERQILLSQIERGKAIIKDIQNGLNRGLLQESDLIGFGLSYDFIERLKNYVQITAIFPTQAQLPVLRNNSTDIYFLGMPSSGKSTMLAALFSYCNSVGILRNVVDNSFGNKYKNQLVLGMAQGHLPSSTPTEFINFIPVNMRYPGTSKDQQLNFLDMAGEKFRNVANGGMDEFQKYQDYLSNQNNKGLIFVLDYFANNRVECLRQDQNLQEVLALIEQFGILKKTDAVYLVVTKADLFPSENKQRFADDYIDNNYRNFLNACQEAKRKYKFELKSFPFSIGPTRFSYILEDCIPTTNRNLEVYPKKLITQIENDFAYRKGGLFGN
jgi:hypothetical protein